MSQGIAAIDAVLMPCKIPINALGPQQHTARKRVLSGGMKALPDFLPNI